MWKLTSTGPPGFIVMVHSHQFKAIVGSFFFLCSDKFGFNISWKAVKRLCGVAIDSFLTVKKLLTKVKSTTNSPFINDG